MKTAGSYSKNLVWTGRIISILCILFLLFDAITKVIKTTATVQGSSQISWPVNLIQPIGIVLLVCTILYIIPRTSILGAILLTGYLGGATAVMARAEMAGHPYFFPVVFGILIWVGLFLRSASLRSLIPVGKQNDDAHSK